MISDDFSWSGSARIGIENRNTDLNPSGSGSFVTGTWNWEPMFRLKVGLYIFILRFIFHKTR